MSQPRKRTTRTSNSPLTYILLHAKHRVTTAIVPHVRERTEDAGHRKLCRRAAVEGAVDAVAVNTHAQRAVPGEGVADAVDGAVVVAFLLPFHRP